mmetsp:Transcript_76672/g.228555  ORF Transcript_76672/g.228555 Transcript_76672/m.228555 type:complete len:225 (-) Transcript_76672:415-1089(-)
MPGVVLVRLTGPQHRAGEVAVVDAVRPQLRLEADGPKLLPHSPLAVPPRAGMVRVRYGVARVHLQTRLVREDVHHQAVGPDELRRQEVLSLAVLAGLGVQAVAHINGSDRIDGRLQRTRAVSEVETRALHRPKLARSSHRRVRRGDAGAVDHKRVVEDAACCMAPEIPVAMVCHAQDGGLVSDTAVVKMQLAAHNFIRNADVHLSGVAHSSIRLRKRQCHRRFR